MPYLGRREFIRRVGFSSAGLLAFHGLVERYGLSRAPATASVRSNAAGFGPLAAAKSKNTGETLLALPKDFQYTVFGKTGTRMFDGHLTPADHDGMAAFRVRNELRLVRNHEVNIKIANPGAAVAPNAYDPMASGGTTTLVVDPNTRELVKDFISLSGTLINCAGGPTPWNSWISCEETVLGPAKVKGTDGDDQGGFKMGHGYCFEVSAAANSPVTPIPLKQMGRFVHEAVAFDPDTGIVYLTEDLPAAGFYRFIPKKKGSWQRAGDYRCLPSKIGQTSTPELDRKLVPPCRYTGWIFLILIHVRPSWII